MPKRKVRKYSELKGIELFDISLSCKYFSEVLQQATQSKGCTVYIQNYGPGDNGQESLDHAHVHIIPRNDGDLGVPDDIYRFIDGYDKEYFPFTQFPPLLQGQDPHTQRHLQTDRR